jgi:hypothetical protein
MSLCYFISGHLDLSETEFQTYYVPPLDAAIASGASFVVGDARGADFMAQQYLKSQHVVNVMVYHMGETPLNNVGYPTQGKFVNHRDKDAAMTLASTHDIAWVRSEKSQKTLYGKNYRKRISGTEHNLQRREKCKNVALNSKV